MSQDRRSFLKHTVIAGAWASLGLRPTEAFGSGRTLLILGGTQFLGPALVEAARAAGFTLTLFNRGKTNPHLFPDVERLTGDRNGKLDALRGRRWDAVVDTSGYVPRQVRESATLLAGSVQHYVFISTISVYADTSKPGTNETAPVGKLQDESVETIDGETYGPLKALCEQAAEKALPGRVTIIRPGLIVGPGDPSDRFTYWPVRVARGGEVLSPGSPSDPLQFIDVRDLADWTIRMIDGKNMGVFNATGPKDPLGIGALLEVCRRVSGSDARFTWVDAEFLEAQKVAPWSDMPVWVPPKGDGEGFARIDIRKAQSKGLTFRPVERTVADTLSWWKTLPEERRSKPKSGIAAEREAEVLRAWRERKAAK